MAKKDKVTNLGTNLIRNIQKLHEKNSPEGQKISKFETKIARRSPKNKSNERRE